MLDGVMLKYYENGDIEDAVVECCESYDDIGDLVAELLEWNSGEGDCDYEVVKLLSAFVREYSETVG